MNISIIMATYNGDKYLSEQLDSIINQSITNWTLIVRDDGSTDDTLEILQRYEKRDSRIKVINDNKGNLGQLKNFNELLEKAKDSDVVFFSDQDDVWYENKLEITLSAFEKMKGPVKLVYTNFSLWKNSDSSLKLFYTKDSRIKFTNNLIVQNWIYGCTMAISRELVDLSLNIPEEAINHDNWIANIANFFGEIEYLNSDTIKHRLHENNVTTTEDNGIKQRFIFLMQSLSEREKQRRRKAKFVSKLIELGEKNNLENKTLNNISKVINSKGPRTIITLNKLKLRGYSTIQTMLFYLMFV